MVEIGATQTDAVIGQDLGPRPIAAEHRKIRGAAADIDNQPDLGRRAHAVTGQGRGLGFGQERHLVEAGRQVTGAQIGLGPRILVRVGRVEMHRPPRQRAAELATRGRFGTLAQLGQKGGDDLGQGAAAAADQARFMQQRQAQHAFQRPHIPPFLPVDQRRACSGADAHGAGIGGKEHRRRQSVCGRLDGDAADAVAVGDGRGGIRGSEIDCKCVSLHGAAPSEKAPPLIELRAGGKPIRRAGWAPGTLHPNRAAPKAKGPPLATLSTFVPNRAQRRMPRLWIRF